MKALLTASRSSRRSNVLKLRMRDRPLMAFSLPLSRIQCRACQAVTGNSISGAKSVEAAWLSQSGRKPELGKSHLHSELERYFSIKAVSAEREEDSIGMRPDAASSGISMCGILEQYSDPQALIEELGMKEEDLYELASQPPTPLKLSHMYKYATMSDKDQRLRNAQFLHKELPIRVAQRAVDLLTLPHGLSDAIPIRQVACAYIAKMHAIRSSPRPETYQDEEKFTDILQSLIMDRASIPMAIARGLAAWSDQQRELHGGEEVPDGDERLQEMEDALYRFFTARVGLRFLTEHHVLSCRRESAKALRKVTHIFPEDKDDHPGCIHSSVDLVREISRVADLVVEQTKEFYGVCPEIEVVDCMDPRKNTGDFTYVPNHLHYMMEQLLKNSCRAVVRHYLGGNKTTPHPKGTSSHMGSLSLVAAAAKPKLPPIRVVIVKGDEDVTIKVADKGGGIPRSKMAKIWKFAHSTADKAESSSDFGMDYLSGFKVRGFGLPLCRIYARYLGGDLTLKSMEGYGLDAYLHLPRLGVACENLPRMVKHSPGERDSTPARYSRNFSTLAAGPRKKSVTQRNNKNKNGSTSPKYSEQVPATTACLMEELRLCLTQEAKNQRILDFLQSRAL